MGPVAALAYDIIPESFCLAKRKRMVVGPAIQSVRRVDLRHEQGPSQVFHRFDRGRPQRRRFHVQASSEGVAKLWRCS